jgi:crossover junction endodeoxyribonuclease RuvC
MSETVIGIDPGSRKTGWGVVAESSGVLSLVACGVIGASGDFSVRLGDMFTELREVLRLYAPGEAAVEELFTCKNIASALKLGQARGIAVGACASLGIPVTGYAPALVKKSLTGNGRAEKTQVSFMVARLLGVDENWGEDAGDALALCICHLNSRRLTRLGIRN